MLISSKTRNHVITVQFSLQGGKKDSIRGNHPKNLMHHGNKVSAPHKLQNSQGSIAVHLAHLTHFLLSGEAAKRQTEVAREETQHRSCPFGQVLVFASLSDQVLCWVLC